MSNNLPWIILAAPLVSAALILLLTRPYRTLSALISVAAVFVSLICSILVFNGPEQTAQYNWLDLGQVFQVPIGFKIDALSKTMLIVVTVVGALVHVYSLGYMADDEGKSRFFAGLSLFMFSMLGIVLAPNFVMMFVFWELVGVSSYILIGHWYQRNAPPDAGNKAFITNRIGDFGFMLGILMLWGASGTFNFEALQGKLHAGATAGLLGNTAFLTVATLLIFCGAVGKSAQFPLHVWLPDAMEGPTPVSALIHAATMVAAGVYMLSRVFFLIEGAPDAATVISWIGVITAVLSALMAVQQNDIKRILAYSTLSQLGYMVAAVGVLADHAAMFHLYTHAFFKALLFLGAGSVIHAMHHEQDIWKMGGLAKKMPITFGTFLIATLALTGCPFFSGFYSKDMILLAAHAKSQPVFYLLLATAFLTAFYMFRLFVVVFLGGGKSKDVDHAHESPVVMTLPLALLAVGALAAGWPFVSKFFFQFPAEEHHESSVLMMATGAFVLGAIGAFALFRGKQEDPIRVKLLANKFYFDEMYAGLIRYTQDLMAKFSDVVDRWILDCGLVRGVLGGVPYGVGILLRFLQIGNIQAYAFLFGLGVVLLIYFAVIQ